MTSDDQQLTPTHRQLLAREMATDKYEPLPPNYTVTTNRRAFQAGWDAAMEYIEQERRLQAEARIIQDAMDGRIK